VMSSAIGATGLGSLTPDQLSTALMNGFLAQIPDGSTLTIKYGASSGGNDQDHAPNGSPQPAVTVSFSPAATAMLNRDQIALELISRDFNQRSDPLPASPTAAAAKTATDPSTAVAPADTGTSLLDQYRQLSVSQQFYATADVDLIASSLAPVQKAGFLAAYQAGTLNIQNAADVPLLDDKETWTVSKTPGGGMSGAGSFNGAVNQLYGQNYLVFGTIFGGDTFVSWGSPPNADQVAGAEAPSVPDTPASVG